MSNKEVSRREFVGFFLKAAVAVPALMTFGKLIAANLKAIPKGFKALDEKVGMGNILGYKHDASQVDMKRFKAKFVAGSNCANCVQYDTTKTKTAEWGECKIIKGGVVAAGGWCSSYVKKA